MGASVAGIRGATSTPSTRRFARSLKSARRHRPDRLSLIVAVTGLSVAGLTAALLGFGTSTAFATTAPPQPAPTPTTPVSGTPPPATAGPLAITEPTSGRFSGSGTMTVTGTKAAGTSVQILAGSPREPVCVVPADEATVFSCEVTLPSGPGISISAVELDGDGSTRESDPISVDVLAPPTIDGPSPKLTSGFVSGTAYPGATLTLTADSGASWTVTVPSSGQWSYGGPRELPSGRHILTATQSTDFSSGSSSQPSSPVTIDLDKDAPPAPAISQPVAGSTIPAGTTVFSGAGESGAAVTVYAISANSAPTIVCQATVTDGLWQCSGDLSVSGTFSITAFQQDQAGNPGASSGETAVTVSGGTPSPSPSPSPQNPPSSDPDDGTAAPPPAPPSQGPPDSDSPAPPDAGAPPSSALPPGPWSARTPFTTSVPSAFDGLSDLSWLRAVLLSVAAIALLLVPARMLASTIGAARGHRARHAAFRLTGRNRSALHDDSATWLTRPSRSLIGTIAIAATAAIVMFAYPIHGEPAYLRLYAASVIAVLIVNLAAAVIPALLVRRRGGAPLEIEVAPRYLFAAVGSALLSRLLGLEPAVLFGLVLAVGFADATDDDPREASPAVRGRLALARIAALFGVGLVAWLASTAIGEPSGLLATFGAEVSNVTAITAIGSGAILLVPLGRLSGRAILAWSRPLWFASAFFAFTVLFALFSPVIDAWQQDQSALVLAAGIGIFGAVGIATWVWRRFISSQL